MRPWWKHLASVTLFLEQAVFCLTEAQGYGLNFLEFLKLKQDTFWSAVEALLEKKLIINHTWKVGGVEGLPQPYPIQRLQYKLVFLKSLENQVISI